jgi:hypothetical protein
VVSFDGQWIVIGKEGVGNIYKCQRRYHISQLSGLAVKPATRLHYGFFQVILTGVAPAPVVRFGPNAGRPPMTDDNSISFARSANEDIRRIQEAVQKAINAAHGRAQPAAPTTMPPADGTPSSNPPHHLSLHLPVPGSDPARPLAESTPDSEAHIGRPQPDQPADHDRGVRDGTQAANRLPLAALDGLIGHQFDVVRWLGPWREHWSSTAGNPEPSAARLPSWLPDLAQYLGRHAASPGSTNSSFTPSSTYLAGFCVGLGKAWNNAVSAGLVPADGPTLTSWITQPPDQLKLPKPLAEATLHDLEAAHKRAHRATLIWWTLRALLWATIGLFLLMEIAAIAITVEGSWTDADGEPAANQTPDAIFANVCCLIPLIGLVTVAVIDLRRIRRNKPQPANPVTHRQQPNPPPASPY